LSQTQSIIGRPPIGSSCFAIESVSGQVGVIAAPVLYLVYSNGRFTLRPVLTTAAA